MIFRIKLINFKNLKNINRDRQNHKDKQSELIVMQFHLIFRKYMLKLQKYLTY